MQKAISPPTERQKILASFIFPSMFVILLWFIHLSGIIFDLPLSVLGIRPLQPDSFWNTLTFPLVHGSFKHLISNSVPLFILGSALWYYYRDIAPRIFWGIYLLSGFWLWFLARSGNHIGASGVVYGLAFFHFISGIIRKNIRLSAFSMLIIFLYGSLIWGFFPEFFPKEKISWEGHLTGAISGIVMAIFFRHRGPQRTRYSWELEDEDEESDLPWQITENKPGKQQNDAKQHHLSNTEQISKTSPEETKIIYLYKPKGDKKN